MDIDLDFGDRTSILNLIQHVPAAMSKNDRLVRHVSGVYVNAIPRNSVSGTAAIDYRIAEQLGYVKLDFLNVSLYKQIRDPAHLNELMNRCPPWQRLRDPEFFSQLIHIGRHYSTMQRMPEPVDSIERMAMFLAVIRPSKRHLIGQRWTRVAQTVWDIDQDAAYGFKKAHGVAYSHLVCVHMNLCDSADKDNTAPLALLGG
jgi:hypothetical protein